MIINPVEEYLAQHAGERIPKKCSKDFRDKIIRDEYDRLIVGKTASEAIDIICRIRGVSESTVRRALKKKHEEEL